MQMRACEVIAKQTENEIAWQYWPNFFGFKTKRLIVLLALQERRTMPIMRPHCWHTCTVARPICYKLDLSHMHLWALLRVGCKCTCDRHGLNRCEDLRQHTCMHRKHACGQGTLQSNVLTRSSSWRRRFAVCGPLLLTLAVWRSGCRNCSGGRTCAMTEEQRMVGCRAWRRNRLSQNSVARRSCSHGHTIRTDAVPLDARSDWHFRLIQFAKLQIHILTLWKLHVELGRR